MKFCDVKDKIKSEMNIVKDCEFERGYLVGKTFDKSVGTISFLGDTKYIDSFMKYDIKGVICTQEVANFLLEYNGGVAITDDPKTTFFEIHNYIAEQNKNEFDSIIDSSAIIHERAIIANKNVRIGANTIIAANAVIKEGTLIGDNCSIQEGTIIGESAFYIYGNEKERKEVKSSGGVIIKNNVIIHANSTICKGVLGGDTVLKENVAMDSHVFIGHDCNVGSNVVLAAGTALGGWSKIGDDCFLGVNSSVAPGKIIGNGCKLSIGTVVTTNISSEKHISGNFAIEHNKYIAHIKKLGGQ